MKQNRGHWNRGTWTRKASLGEEADPSLLSKNPPMRNVAKDESDTWAEIARVEDSGSCWDTRTFDVSFFDDNRKIFQWDDSGAVDYLKKAEVKLQQGISSVYSDYLNDSNQFADSIDWDTRWSCTLPDCAEDFVSRDEKKKNPKASSIRRDQYDTSSAIILGLPEPKDDTGCSGTPSLHLPLHFVPLPTGWDEAEDNPTNARWEDSAKKPLKAAYVEDKQVEPTSQGWWQTTTNRNDGSITGSGWPQYPSSYRHIIPSGWEDVQVDQPVVPSGWGSVDLEPGSDTQMHQADISWCDYPSYSSRPAWGNPHASAVSHPVYGKSQSGKQHDLYNKSHKYGYWRPKRGSETSNYESSERRNIQRPGRPISTIHRANHDPRSPRINRSECSKAQ